MELGKTKDYDLIPLEHECIRCGRNKTKVAFTVMLRKSGNKYPYGVCNECRYDKVEVDGRSLRHTKHKYEGDNGMRFDKTHCKKHTGNEKLVQAMLSTLSTKTTYITKVRTTRTVNGNGEFYVRRNMKTYDVDECIDFLRFHSDARQRFEYLELLEIVKEDLEDYPDGVPDTSDEWEDIDIAKQSARIKAWHNREKYRTVTDKPKEDRHKRRRDFVKRWNETYNK